MARPDVTAFERVVDLLRSRGPVQMRGDQQASARCPAHDDGNPSLSIKGADEFAGVLISCHAGCALDDILAALSLVKADLFDEKRDAKRGYVVTAEYPYVDEHGTVLYVKERRQPKDFRQYRPEPGGRRSYSLGDVRRVLYRLPAVLEAIAAGQPVYVAEGEKDADALTKAGVCGTTWGDGAWRTGQSSKWRAGYTKTLLGADVVIVRDKDEPGAQTAADIAAVLTGSAASVRIVEAATGKDAYDHLAEWGTVETLTPVNQDDPDPAGTSEGPGRRGPSQASQLVEQARKTFELFMSEDGRPYGRVIDGPNIALPLRGRAGLRSQLARRFTDAHRGSVPSASALSDAMTVLEGIAASEVPRVPHIRVASYDGAIVVDLAEPDGRCVVIDPSGWRREARSPVLFRRSGAMKPLPEPIRDGDGLAKLRALMNTSDEGFHLLVAWIVAAFMPDLPHPILTFRGEQGTGKSKGAAMVIGIVDPSGAPKRTAPRDLKSWATQAFNSWALCLDNVSTIADWLSDALCRAVTGDGIVDRALYSDDDVVVLEFRRVLAMTTIDAGALAGDLAERMLIIELHTIPDAGRREEQELDAVYRDAHPAVLASLFDLIASVLKVLPNVTLTERPRMADFARVLAAVDEVTGWSTLDSYRATSRDAVSDVLEADLFAQAVAALVDRSAAGEIELTAGEILDEAEKLMGLDEKRKPKKWPADATRAGGQLKRLAPALRTTGIDVTEGRRGRGAKKQRIYRLTASPDRRSATASPASPLAGDQAVTSQNSGDAGCTPSASPLPLGDRAGDAGRAGGDAGQPAASPSQAAPDLRGYQGGDAGVAGDAALRLSSNEAACRACGHQLDPAVAAGGFTTHPACEDQP